MMSDEELTTISIRKTTAQKLKQLWQHADDTYDLVLNRLMEEKK